MKAHTTPTPSSLAPRPPDAIADASHSRVDSVEDRLLAIEQLLAVLRLLTQGQTTAELSLSTEDQAAAWAGLENLVTDALAHVRAVTRALPAESHYLPAPDAVDAVGEAIGGVQ